MPWHQSSASTSSTSSAPHPPEEAPLNVKTDAKVQIIDDIREWGYGDYEGKTSKQIREERERDGQGKWDIWRDGCPGGEYVMLTSLMILLLLPQPRLS